MIKLLIADDHQIIVDGFLSIFKDYSHINVVGSASNGKEVLQMLEETPVDVVILDINMPILNGVETCKQISKRLPQVAVIALSMYKRQSYIQRMLQYGAKGYLLKDDHAEDIIKAVDKVYAGEHYFSPQIEPALLSFGKLELIDLPEVTERELEVLKLISKGYTNVEIADQLFISHHTVESHRKNLLSKLDAKNTADLVRLSLEKGLI